MSEVGDDDVELPGARSPGARPPSGDWEYDSGKTLRFALIAVGVCVTFGIATAMLMSYVAHGVVATGGASMRANVAAVAVVPAKPVPGKKPKVPNILTYTADGGGHYFIDAAVNGTPIRFLVDTGATFVALSPADAVAIGIAPSSLSFTEATNTANGVAHVARTSLRSVRLGQLEAFDVAAVVLEQPTPMSLLGMSFLSRVESYSIRDGVLTIEW